MRTFTLSSTNLTETVLVPHKAIDVKIATAGTWVGTVEIQYTINGETRTYTDGTFTSNFDIVLDPATDDITLLFTRTSGSVEGVVSRSEY